MEDSSKILLGDGATLSPEDAAEVEDLDCGPQESQKLSTTKDPAIEKAKDEALAKELQDLSRMMMLLLNEEDPLSKPYARKYLAETYKSNASIADEPGTQAGSSSSHFANVAAFRKRNPKYRIEIYNTTAHVNRDTGRAMVWVTLQAWGLPGLPDDASRESVCAIHWKKLAGGLWVLFRTTGLRGPGSVGI
ncbi:hypothetical protein PRZ48_013572 [Zasmidium cellare]|uniref:Uncharacterized protein n=1 Tax=Zasmidium cellare TaxID=395010 RepID=A0ABR0E1E6_ZASCE|nr:hypothetical protein PRZ48_013572 [Zasmidium cellare]